MTTSVLSRVEVDQEGVAWISGTNTKVLEVVLDKTAYGWSPEEIHFQHPHLSLAQIHAALAFYYDHAAEIEAEIERRHAEAESFRATLPESALRKRLRELKKHP